jgi:hypothetical protein
MKGGVRMGEKKLIRFDWALKYILRNKANFDVLEGFLSNLLKETTTINHIIESESNQEAENCKFNRVDLKWVYFFKHGKIRDDFKSPGIRLAA